MKRLILALCIPWCAAARCRAQFFGPWGSSPSSPTVAASTPTTEARGIVFDLQTMGVPASAAHYVDPSEALDALYDHNPSSPTALGRRLHQALGRLNRRERAQLQFKLARNDYTQLGEALRILAKTLSLNEGDVHDALLRAYMDKAVEVLRPGASDPALPAAEKEGPAVREVLLAHRDELKAKQALLTGLVDGALPLLLGRNPEALKKFSAPWADERGRLAETLAALDALTGGSGQLTPRALLSIVRTLPEDKLNEAQWKALASAFPMGESINRLEAMRLWRAGLTGKGVKVGLIDDGADGSHPYLTGVKVYKNFTNERLTTGPNKGKPDDRGERGTHAAGVIRALAPEAEIRVYKAAESSPFSVPKELRMHEQQRAYATVKALQCAADDGCSVVNLGLSFESGNPNSPDILTDKAKELRGKLLLVAPAGDRGKDDVAGPAYSPDVLAVGSVSYTRRQASSSSRGDVFVPGDKAKIVTKPDCLAFGVETCSASFHSNSDYKDPRSAASRKSGTPFASAQVSAIAALLQQRARQLGHPLTPDETRRLLLKDGLKPVEGPYGVTIVNPVAALK